MTDPRIPTPTIDELETMLLEAFTLRARRTLSIHVTTRLGHLQEDLAEALTRAESRLASDARWLAELMATSSKPVRRRMPSLDGDTWIRTIEPLLEEIGRLRNIHAQLDVLDKAMPR